MSVIVSLREQYGASVASLSVALAQGDSALFVKTLDEMMRLREKNLVSELRRLTSGLQGALDRFRMDSRLADLVQKEVPDARHRLDYVLKLTDEAAHKTLDLVEQSGPLAERTSKGAAELAAWCKQLRTREISTVEFRSLLDRVEVFLNLAQTNTDIIRVNLAEVHLAQGYQDITGQIIRSVSILVNELEQTLGDLVLLSAETANRRVDPADLTERAEAQRSRAQGPAVPGVNNGPSVSGQQDVDSLLSGLGL